MEVQGGVNLSCLLKRGLVHREQTGRSIVYTFKEEYMDHPEVVKFTKALQDSVRPAANWADPFRNIARPSISTLVTMDDFWVSKGWYKCTHNGIKLTRAKWSEDSAARSVAVKFLVEEVLKKKPRDITQTDFYNNRLNGLLTDYYKSSSYLAIHEVYPEIMPWEMIMTPHGYFKNRENRAVAIKWLVEEKLKKDKAGTRHNCQG